LALFLAVAPTFPLTEAKAEKILKNGGTKVLGSIVETLRSISDWTEENLDAGLRRRAEELELGFGKLAQPLRVALTGSTASPGIFDVMVILGRDESLSRVMSLLDFESE
jgi:glutamyl-tRNA synthetase